MLFTTGIFDMRNYNVRKIKVRSAYTVKDIVKLLDVTPGTVYRWHDDGLKPIKEGTQPLLFYGHELRRYISARQQGQKVKLRQGEMYCVKCRVGKYADSSKIRIEKTGNRIGKENREQECKRAPCPTCGTTMHQFL